MSNSKLIELSYYDPSAQVRLSAYADTLVLDHDQNGSIISAIRFGGYPEMVRAMADAIYGGATIEAAQNDTTRMLQSSLKSYQRQITHDGIYAVATLMAADTVQEDDRSGKHEKDEDTNLVDTEQMELQPRRCYIFCPARDQKRLFEELDHKTAAPLIPEFQDYVLSSLRQRGDLRQLEVISLKERIDAWVLDLKPQDQNVVEVLERGLQSGDIQIPGAVPNMPDGFENVENVTGYLNTFGVTVADRIRNQFMPLFDPAKEPLSDEVLAINDCIMSRVGYSLYDAQLAVAEAVKRQLARKRVALIIAECGSGKTKIGSTALGALHGLWADQKRKDGRKSFGIVTAVCSFSIAVDRDFKSKNGEKETDFIDIVAWRATAEFVSKYFTKGRMAVVEGRLQIRDWTDKEGGKRRSAEVIADNVYFGDSKPKDGGEEDDIPAYTGAPDSFAVPDGFTPDFGGESGEMPF